LHRTGRWFGLNAESVDLVKYAGIALNKVGIFLFNLVPYIALLIVV